MREEIKDAALRQLAEGGPAGVSVNAIGRELGVSGPALYRYFASRDALLTELVIDAYEDLAAALRDTVSGRRAAPAARLRALARAYRAWAIAHPHRYGLLFGPPLPGHDAHSERIVAASDEAMAVLLAVLAETGEADAAARARAAARDRAPRVEPRARDGHEPGGRAARGDGVGAAARLRGARDRRQLRVDGPRPGGAVRGGAVRTSWRDRAVARRTGRMRA